MTSKILKSILLLSTLAMIISSCIIAGLLNRYFSHRIEDELVTEAGLIGRGAELSGPEYFRNADFHGMHVTWAAPDGRILFDTEGRRDSAADDRDFVTALREGHADSSRYSSNLEHTSLRYALRLRDGTVVMVSDVKLSFMALLLNILRPLLISIAVVSAASILLANLVSRHIVRPINSIDLDDPKEVSSCPELSPLINKIRTQNRNLGNQMEELRRSREQFSLITESMSEGLIVADPKLNVLACNSGALRLLGAESGGAGQSIFAINRSDSFRKCIQNAAGGRHSEIILSTPDGDREVIASPASSTDTVNGIVVFIMDVTEKQQLETMRREFTSNVSHELKTPLTTIYGISDMLANGMVKAEDVPRFGEKIRSEADRLIILINDIVSLSKLDENTAPAPDEEIDLYELADEVNQRLSVSAAEKNVTGTVTGEHIIYKGSRTILSEVLYNLCDNAIKYNTSGGGYEVHISHIPKSVFITVSDTGMGIPQQHISRIFERFYRVDKSRSRKIKGTGLGLSIVKHGVMYHDGTVRCESIPGKGTVFTVELPVSK